jgi:hypothetical protein
VEDVAGGRGIVVEVNYMIERDILCQEELNRRLLGFGLAHGVTWEKVRDGLTE